ncbi:autotransporter family protein, partial [Paludibacterium paludis]
DSTIDTLELAGNVTYQVPRTVSIKTLRVTNLVGENGVLTVNAQLGGSSSSIGHLIIDGGRATGSTRLAVRNLGGLGGLTQGDGIRVIQSVNGASTAQWQLSLLQPVLAGAYDYRLKRGAAQPDDWYLSSDSGGKPSYRSEVSLDMTVPAVALRYGAMVAGSWRERRGDADEPYWGRAMAQTVRHDGARDGIAGGAAKFRADLYGAQAGADLYRRSGAGDAGDRAGVYAAIGRSTAHVTHSDGGPAGKATLDGYALGGYWTRRGAAGWYLDGVLQANWSEVTTRSSNNLTLRTHGLSWLGSLEAGYGFRTGAVTIEPQVQLAYQRLRLADAGDEAAAIQFGRIESIPLRVGVRIARPLQRSSAGPLTVWFQPSVMHEFKATQQTGFVAQNGSRTALGSDLAGSSLIMAAGVGGWASKTLRLDVKADYKTSLSGKAFHGFGLTFAVNARF